MANLLRKAAPQSVGVPSLMADWDPFRVMDSLLRWEPAGKARRAETMPMFAPLFDVKETADSYLYKADLPGVKESDLDISLVGNRLTVSGKREVDERQEGETYFLVERSYGSFSRTFTLPDSADTQHVKAELKDGLLTVVLPKRVESQPRKISVYGSSAT